MCVELITAASSRVFILPRHCHEHFTYINQQQLLRDNSGSKSNLAFTGQDIGKLSNLPKSLVREWRGWASGLRVCTLDYFLSRHSLNGGQVSLLQVWEFSEEYKFQKVVLLLWWVTLPSIYSVIQARNWCQLRFTSLLIFCLVFLLIMDIEVLRCLTFLLSVVLVLLHVFWSSFVGCIHIRIVSS